MVACCAGPHKAKASSKPTEEKEDSLVRMGIAQLETRALELGVLASDVARAMEGPPSGIQKATLVDLVSKKQAERRKSTGFGALLSKLAGNMGPEDAFREFDADNSGYLDRAEVAAAFARLGAELGPGGIDEVMAHMDADGNGEVSMGEFLQYWAVREQLGRPPPSSAKQTGRSVPSSAPPRAPLAEFAQLDPAHPSTAADGSGR